MRHLLSALACTKPLAAFWGRVQSWREPRLTMAVAAAEAALLAWPGRVLALAALAAALALLRARARMLAELQQHLVPSPPALDAPASTAATSPTSASQPVGRATSASGSGPPLGAGGSCGALAVAELAPVAATAAPRFGEPAAMVEDLPPLPDRESYGWLVVV